MDGIGIGLKKMFTIAGILILIICSIIVFFSNMASSGYSGYIANKFVIRINDNDLIFRNDEECKIARHNCVQQNADYKNGLNRISNADSYILNVLEYEGYDSFGHRQSTNPETRNINIKVSSYELIDSNIKRLRIQKSNKTIYDGKYMEDISDYIKEDGRYYFYVYSVSKRGILSNVKSNIYFNVEVGDNNEQA